MDSDLLRLSVRPFRGSVAVRAGLLTRKQLRGTQWLRLFQDVYVHRDVPLDLRIRVDAVSLLLPAGGVVSGRTAAWLYGGIMPRPTDPVELTLPRDTPLGPRSDLTIRRALLDEQDVTTVAGLPVTTALRTAFDLARLRKPRHQRQLIEAVVALDALAHAKRFDQDELLAYALGHPGWRGVRLVSEVVRLVDDGAESPMETRLRLVLVFGGLPRPVTQFEIRRRGGGFVARVDLAYPELKIAIEYDGEDHRDQWAEDIVRQNAIIGEGWTLMRYTKHDVFQAQTRILRQVGMAIRTNQAA